MRANTTHTIVTFGKEFDGGFVSVFHAGAPYGPGLSLHPLDTIRILPQRDLINHNQQKGNHDRDVDGGG